MLDSYKAVLEFSKIEIDLRKCTKCKACVNDCPTLIYYFENDELTLQDYSDDECIECGHCVAICPEGAISTKNLPREDIIEITDEMKVPSYNELLNSIKIRRSIRQFKDKPISDDIWDKLIEAVRYAPTAHNDQHVHITIVRTPEILARLEEEMTRGYRNLIDSFKDPIKYKQFEQVYSKAELQAFEDFLPTFELATETAESGKGVWNHNREVILIHGPESNAWSPHECGIAACNIMLTAESLGVSTCSLGFLVVAIDQFKPVSKLLKVPRKHSIQYALAVGYPKVKYHRIPARQPAKLSWV